MSNNNTNIRNYNDSYHGHDDNNNNDDDFPEYSPDYQDDGTTEIAHFVDATMQDISHIHNENDEDGDANMNTTKSKNNGVDNDQKANDSRNKKVVISVPPKNGNGRSSKKNRSKSKSKDNKSMNNSSSNLNTTNRSNQSNDKSTDDCLDALFEDGGGLRITDAEAQFFNSRKNELQKELEEERRRSKMELERLADDIRSGADSSAAAFGEGMDGNGVQLGKVNDYIGKMKFDNSALLSASQIDDESDEGHHGNDSHNGNAENKDHNNDDKNANIQNDPSQGGTLGENADDLSVDNDEGEKNNDCER